MIFTGTSVSYWGPIQYTIAMACPIFAFFFSFASKFVKGQKYKMIFLYTYCVVLYVIAVSMIAQFLNQLGWILFFSVPHYLDIATEFPELIKPAFTSIAIYIPITTFYPLFKWLYRDVNDTKDITDSIMDYGGIDLSDQKTGTGPYTCEIVICKDDDTGKEVKILENTRFQSTIVVGVSGTGKTTMVFEPMIARDIEKKYFFKEIAKEMAYTALKTGIATLNCPYDNQYINQHFHLNMITPNPYKQTLYKAYMKKMIYATTDSGEFQYRNLGLTYLAPDSESIEHMISVAENFGIPYHIIDPDNTNSIGLNPFAHEDPSKTAVAISSVLKGMYASTHVDVELAFRENAAAQAIENLAILLKEMYPKLHEGLLPNLEDMLKMLNNFDLVEKMCEILKQDPELAEKYSIQLGYFQKNFYKNSSGREDTEKFVFAAATELDNLLRYPGVKRILCSRSNNINFDKALSDGEITFICTRRGDLGAAAHKAFGLFVLLLMQYSVLTRPGIEQTRTPHFLYVDEFANYVGSATEPMFTLYRKYRVGSIISIQNLDQLGVKGKNHHRQTILSNCTSKIVFGNGDRNDNDWWEREFGDKREWKMSHTYNTDKGEYDPKKGSIQWAWKENYNSGKFQSLKFKVCLYKTKNNKGKNIVGVGKVDFLETKYKEKHSDKTYNFAKFTNGIYDDEKESKKKNKFIPGSVNFKADDGSDEVDPIQTNTTDASFFYDNEDAIIFDITRKNSNNNN